MNSKFDVSLDFHMNDEQKRKFTYNADDWVLFLKMDCITKKQALNIERDIKSMKSKIYIENLVEYPNIGQKLFEKYLDC